MLKDIKIVGNIYYVRIWDGFHNEIFRDTYEIKDGKAIKLIQGISEKQDGYNGELTDEVLNQEKEAFDEFYIKTTS